MSLSFGFRATAKKFQNIVNYIAKTPDSTETEPLKPSQLAGKTLVAPWGVDNNFPDYLDAQIAHSEDIEGSIQTLTEFSCGLDIVTVIEEVDANGKLITKPFLCPEFETLKESYNFSEHYVMKAFYNFFRYANVFIEFSISEGKIIRLFTKDAPYCRISTLDKIKGISKYLFQSSDFSPYKRLEYEDIMKSQEKKDGLISAIPLVDPRNPIYDTKEYIKNGKTLLGYHIKDYSPGDAYYGKSPWYPILTNGWLEIAKSAPAKIKAYYDNLITLAFKIGINIDFFKDTIDGFNDLTVEKQKEELQKLQTSVDDNLSGRDNSYKSIFYQMRRGQNGEMESMLNIESLGDTLRDSTVLKDVQHISSVFQAAFRLDDSIINGKNTGSKEADAGSEKKSAANLLQLRLSVVRNQILYPLYIWKQVNGIDPRVKFQISTNLIETTDVAPSGQQNTNL